MSRSDLIALGLFAFAAVAAPRLLTAAETITPSFDCKYAKRPAELLICSSSELAQLDRQLGEIFDNTRFQAGIDGKALRRDEDRWLRDVRDPCANVGCLRTAYLHRIDELKDQSLRAASPAAYEETRPFAVAETLSAEMRNLIGKPCSFVRDEKAMAEVGLSAIPGFLPVIAQDGVVYPRAKQGARLAFLADTHPNTPDGCKIVDVVALPAPNVANAFLQCDMHLPDYTKFAGVGMRLAGKRKLVAYWSIDTENNRLQREPLGVLSADVTVRCQEPESGE